MEMSSNWKFQSGSKQLAPGRNRITDQKANSRRSWSKISWTLKLYKIFRNWIQYASNIASNRILTCHWLYSMSLSLCFMGFHWENHLFMNAIIEFNMIGSPSLSNRHLIEIRVQIGAAGIREKTNYWSQNKSETFIIEKMMSHWIFIKSQEIQYNMLLKPLRVHSLPSNDHDSWIRNWILLIFVEKTIHSLNARAGAGPRASSETAGPGTFGTFTFRTARAESCKRRV